MRPVLNTLGCHKWSLETICKQGPVMGFEAVDFRGLAGVLDVTQSPAFTKDLAASRRQLEDAGLPVACLSSGIQVCEPDALAKFTDEAKRTIDLAQALDCHRVRVFGGGDGGQQQDIQTLAHHGAQTVAKLIELDSDGVVQWCLETHDHWTRGQDCRLMLDALQHDRFGIVWDIAHTLRLAGETPQQTLDALGDRVAYLHIKDAIHDPNHPQAMKDGWRYVMPGQGELALIDAMRVLAAQGFDGDVAFEHEKKWHPELPEPEEAMPAFMAWYRGMKTQLQ